jgi:hypothetical protein
MAEGLRCGQRYGHGAGFGCAVHIAQRHATRLHGGHQVSRQGAGACPHRAQTGQIDAGLSSLRGVNAENGRKQAQADGLGARASDRVNLLQGVISGYEDADLGQIATDLAQQKSVLQASYSVFSQLSGLSLVNYLK